MRGMIVEDQLDRRAGRVHHKLHSYASPAKKKPRYIRQPDEPHVLFAL
jgi:hypothetical protein